MGKSLEREDGATAAGGATVADEELVTWWGLVVEGCDRTTRRTVRDLGVDVAVPGPWFEVLLRLLRTPGHRLPMTRLAHEVSLTSGGFTKFADRLVRAGLIERQGSASDRRVTYVALTGEGLDIARRAHERHVAALRRHFLGALGEQDAERLAALMRRLRDANTEQPG
jgi:DNA-binding MarR family transcriptional regulator